MKVGNTEVVAKMVKEITDGELFQIDTVKNYPEDYYEATVVAQKELRKKARPKLTAELSNMEEYDTIILGYPNWWGTMPMAVYTFLEAYDFSYKTIIPFCTHEGSGLGQSEKEISKLCPKSKIMKGLAIRGVNANDAKNDVARWLKKALIEEEPEN